MCSASGKGFFKAMVCPDEMHALLNAILVLY